MDSILASVDRTNEKLDLFMRDLLQTSSHQSAEGTSKRSMLFRELWKADWRPDQDTIHGLETSLWDGYIQEDVINSLWFDTIESREKAISKAYESTYDWIFDPNGSTCFTAWMEENQSQLYWITGKAGSGKSTLMKYLAHHHLTTQHLEKWADGLPLLFCHFYFWEATADELQHSREGLIRSLLWQCFQNNPKLVKKATLRRWAAYYALRGWEGPVPDWCWEELQETFLNLASLNNSSFKMVMFIDGLDEFDGDPNALIQWIKDIIVRFNIKLCVGSRPWTAFSDAFEQYPTLTMQTLTAVDIQTYINGHFNTSRAFRDWQVLYPDGTEALRQDLIERADGVFLWVHVVVRELMLALKRGRNLQDLSVILNSLPTDIIDLYTKIYGSADPGEANNAAVYLSLMKAVHHSFTHDELWYIEENTTVDPNDKVVGESITRVIRRRLDSSTRGMMDVSGDGVIVFHHRSVREWLLLPEISPILHGHLSEHFDATLLLMKGCRSILVRQLQVIKSCSAKAFGNILFLSCEALYRILYYASQVVESAILTPALHRELEMARDAFDTIADAIKNRGEGGLRKLAELQDKFNSTISQRLKAALPTDTQHSAASTIKVDKFEIGHWSFLFHPSRATTQSCFTALAAQFAVHTYVIAQVRESPDLLKEKHDRVSLLHSAIFGPQLEDKFRHIRSVDYRLRLRLIEALLDFGTSSRGRLHFRYTDFDDGDFDYNRKFQSKLEEVGLDAYYLDVVDRLSKSKREEIGPDEYWTEVMRLLEVRMSKGTHFQRSLRVMIHKMTSK